MLLPPDSPRSRILWSIPAAAIIAIWAYGILAAGATSFPVSYSPSQTIKAIAENWRTAIWPGEFGRDGDLVVLGMLFQFSPVFAALLWSLSLVAWKRRWKRVLSITSALIVPGWIVVIAPHWIFLRIPTGLKIMFAGGFGEDYQDDGPWASAIALWWCMLLPLVIMTFLRRTPNSNVCPKCGYSREGLAAAALCPECGTDTLPA